MLLREKLERLQAGQPADISRFAASLRPEWIEEALQATGKATFRKRKLPAHTAIWVVLGMALFGDRSILKVVEHLELVIDGIIASSAISRARKRLGVEPIQWLFERVSQAWAHQNSDTWHGLSTYGLDGSHLRVNDSDENAEHFGRPRGRATAGYPQLRFVALMNLSQRLLCGGSVGPWAQGETTLAQDLWRTIPDDSLTIVDRGFLSYKIFDSITSSGDNKHFLCRAKSDTRYEVTHCLPDGSALAILRKPDRLEKMSPATNYGRVIRVIAYQHPGSKEGVLLTSMTDHNTYPAADIVKLYHQRWELEIAFDELKTHLLNRKESLRSKTVDGVYQEFWGILLLYNLVRREMAGVAEERGVAANRVSFTGALFVIQGFFLGAHIAAPGLIPCELADLRHRLARTMILPPRRSERRYPRQVKIKMSGYNKAPPRERTSRESQLTA